MLTNQVDGHEYVATVEEKERALQKYKDAREVSSGSLGPTLNKPWWQPGKTVPREFKRA